MYEQALFFRPLVYKTKVSLACARPGVSSRTDPTSSAKRQGQRLAAAVRRLVLRSRSERHQRCVVSLVNRPPPHRTLATFRAVEKEP